MTVCNDADSQSIHECPFPFARCPRIRGVSSFNVIFKYVPCHILLQYSMYDRREGGGVALIESEIVVPRYGFGGSVVFIEVVYQLVIA